MTLIELLAALAIGTIVIGLAFSVLINSMISYKKTESQQLLQQEANILLMQLRNIHRENKTYTIAFDSIENIYIVTLANGDKQPLGQSQYKTEISIDGQLITTSPYTIKYAVKQFKILINIQNEQTKNEFTIETGLTRL